MLLDIIKSKKNPDSDIPFEFEFEADKSILKGRLAKFSDKAVISGTYKYNDGRVYVDSEIYVKIEYNCDLCLKPAVYNMVVEFNEVFHQGKEQEDEFTYEGEKVNLQKAVHDLMLLEMPAGLYCAEECKGLCEVCGIDLNIATCNCIKSLQDGIIPSNPFDILKDL